MLFVSTMCILVNSVKMDSILEKIFVKIAVKEIVLNALLTSKTKKLSVHHV